MNRFPKIEFSDFSTYNMADLKMAQPIQDLTKKAEQDAAKFLAQKLDEAIKQFAWMVAGYEMPIHEIGAEGQIVKLQTHSTEEPNEWENFFLFRGRCLAYRYLTGSHVNETNHAFTLDWTFQSVELPEEFWPQPLKTFLEDQK